MAHRVRDGVQFAASWDGNRIFSGWVEGRNADGLAAGRGKRLCRGLDDGVVRKKLKTMGDGTFCIYGTDSPLPEFGARDHGHGTQK